MAMQLAPAAGAQAANFQLARRCCWNRSSCAIKSPCWERSGTRRPCFCLWDRLFWILFLRWWSQWRNSLIIVQPETVLRWCREGWSGLWRYRSRGRWRGGRPRISNEIRQLIVRMTRENFLWGAPRIHGELLMLGFTVSQATVSRYMPPANRRP